jgi:hypothetical protein
VLETIFIPSTSPVAEAKVSKVAVKFIREQTSQKGLKMKLNPTRLRNFRLTVYRKGDLGSCCG